MGQPKSGSDAEEVRARSLTRNHMAYVVTGKLYKKNIEARKKRCDLHAK